MKVTDINIRIATNEKLMAYATVVLDEVLVIHNIKIINNNEEYFIAMPSRKTKTGEFKDIVHPIKSDFRLYLQDYILAEYKKSSEEESSPML